MLIAVLFLPHKYPWKQSIKPTETKSNYTPNQFRTKILYLTTLLSFHVKIACCWPKTINSFSLRTMQPICHSMRYAAMASLYNTKYSHKPILNYPKIFISAFISACLTLLTSAKLLADKNSLQIKLVTWHTNTAKKHHTISLMASNSDIVYQKAGFNGSNVMLSQMHRDCQLRDVVKQIFRDKKYVSEQREIYAAQDFRIQGESIFKAEQVSEKINRCGY